MVGIGFFAPFPLALMVPFMAGQSLAMGEAFGKGFQYGKRKISSMSNEEFNALDFQKLSESIHTDYKVMIPSLIQSIEESTKLQGAVFDALGKVILSIPKEILDFVGDIGKQITTGGASFSNNPTTSQLVNPAGISALMKLWEDMGIINKGSQNKFNKQFSEAKLQAETKSAEQIFIESGKQGPTQTISRNIQPSPTPNTIGGPDIRGTSADPRQIQRVTAQSTISNITKRRAGQSQKLERTKLINSIRKNQGYIASFNASIRKVPSGGSKVALRAQRDKFIIGVNKQKQSLANLEARYLF